MDMTGKHYKANLSFFNSPLVLPSISIMSNILINGLFELANFGPIVSKCQIGVILEPVRVSGDIGVELKKQPLTSR